jgi:23S rRNA (pseudouridine1915-N3)-methyltransferase
MRSLIIAVGHRLPSRAEAACAEFRKRLGRSFRLDVLEVDPESRRSSRTPAQLLEAEGRRIELLIPAGARRVALDERGKTLTTLQFARQLQSWLNQGRDTVFLIGSADGLAGRLKDGADLVLQLSSLTLPHALARVILLEQIYRAQSVLDNRPYHRE